jgi:hypothetical protein
MAKTNENKGQNNAASEAENIVTASTPTVEQQAPVKSADDIVREKIDEQAILLATFLRQVPATRAGLMSFNWHDKAADIVHAVKGVQIPRKGDNGKGLSSERRRLGDVCRAIGGGYWSAADDKDSAIVSKVCADFGAKFHGKATDCLAVCRAIVVAVLEGRKAQAGGVIVTPAAVDAFKAELASA